MGIRFYCPNGHKLNVKEFQAGRTGICPVCGEKTRIPLESTRPSSKQEPDSPQEGAAGVEIEEADLPQPLETPNETVPTLPTRKPGQSSLAAFADPLVDGEEVVWYVRPASGGQFGPANPDLMREWLVEGRIGPDSLVWREGWRDWQTAIDVFPQLSPNQPIPGLEMEPVVPDLVVTPLHSHPLPAHRRAQARNTRMIAIGSLVLVVVLLIIILLAMLLNK